ncbi:MAG: EamA family transporter [Nitrospinota bacterium]|jgi:transporter family protein|nr:EamA family transporter [Nitrospinota bacterium]
MEAPLFALLTAFCIGSADFSSHYGLRHLKPMQGGFFMVCIQLVTILAAILLFRDWTVPDWRGPVYYILAGVFHPGLFFYVLLNAVERNGPARTVTFKATAPLFGVAIAFLVLGERPTLAVYVGLFLVVGGVMRLSSGGGGLMVRGRGIFYLLAAAFIGGLMPNLAKFGLKYLDDPVMGPFFAVIGGILTLFIGNTILARRTGGAWFRTTSLKGVLLFLPMGVLGGMGWIFYYTALTHGSVSQVLPLVQLAPFFAILYSRLFIQEQERVNLRLIFSAAAIVLGAVLITMGRA